MAVKCLTHYLRLLLVMCHILSKYPSVSQSCCRGKTVIGQLTAPTSVVMWAANMSSRGGMLEHPSQRKSVKQQELCSLEDSVRKPQHTARHQGGRVIQTPTVGVLCDHNTPHAAVLPAGGLAVGSASAQLDSLSMSLLLGSQAK